MQSNRRNSAVILVIDEDPLMLTAVAAALHLMGHQSHCAQDLSAAIKAGQQLELDLIICDIDIEEESGIELCQEIREIPGREDTPVIFLSSRGVAGNLMQKSRQAGGAYCLAKPYDPEVLLELVEKALWMPHLVSNRMKSEQTVSAL